MGDTPPPPPPKWVAWEDAGGGSWEQAVDADSDTPGQVPQVPDLVPAPMGAKVLLGGQRSSWRCLQPSCSGAAPWQGLGG